MTSWKFNSKLSITDSHYMRFRLCSSSLALLACAAALSISAAFGQSLSITNKPGTNYWVEASGPLNNPYTLQASANLHLWVDVEENVQEPQSFQFNKTGDSHRYFRLNSAPPVPPIIVMLLGDSLISDSSGWGAGIYGYFKPNVTVVNYAMPGTTMKLFLSSAERDGMLLVKPNYVLINYGAIDGMTNYPDTYTTPEEYKDNLRTTVQLIRGFNGVPIFVTVHAGRQWDENGKVIPLWQERNALKKEVAAELQVYLIDLYQITEELFNELGPSGTAFMHHEAGGPLDIMHLSPLGAQYVARLVVNELPDELGAYLTGILDPSPTP
jgi:lysophospholipase L1-like esterase